MLLMALALVQAASGGAAAPALTAQQAFDEATAALDRRDFAAAISGFDALSSRLKRQPLALAVAQARKARALVGLGRNDEAVPLFRAALQQVPATNPDYRADRYTAALTLAMIEEAELDYAASRQDYAAAGEAADVATDKIAALIGRARTTMFDDPTAAIALIDRAKAMTGEIPKLSPAQIGQLHTLRGRAFLNAGDVKAAKTELGAAITQLGGLTARVDKNDIAARSDLAIASLLDGDREAAKKYLAYSGAGNQAEPFRLGADMNPPACGEGGLQPQDVAVIEFGVADDGTVRHPLPVYSSARGDKALVFARAVADWSWKPEDAAKIPPFFRAQTRLEMRCTTTVERSNIDQVALAAYASWLAERKVTPFEASGSAASQLTQAKAELARRVAANGDAITLLPLLTALAMNPSLTPEDSQMRFRQASDIAEAAKAPPLARAALAAMNTPVEKRDWSSSTRVRLAWLTALKERPDFAADARTSAYLSLRLADELIGKRSDEALPYLEAIAQDRRIEAGDPFQIAALTRIASIKATQGNLAEARSAFLKTGIDAQQCALVDVSPVRVRGQALGSDAPQEAVAWGISGWAATEFDIRADGTTTNIRTVVAYPPFVYGAPMEKVAARSRYTQSYRPDGGLGCGGYRSFQGFRIIL